MAVKKGSTLSELIKASSSTATGPYYGTQAITNPYSIPMTNTVTKEVQVIDEELKQLLRDLLVEIKSLNEKLL